MKPWQRKIRKEHAKRARMDTPGDWAASLCKVLIWYGEKHPEAGIDVEKVREVLACRPQWREIVRRRDLSGFTVTVTVRWTRVSYRTVTNKGLPPIPTGYTEFNLATGEETTHAS